MKNLLLRFTAYFRTVRCFLRNPIRYIIVKRRIRHIDQLRAEINERTFYAAVAVDCPRGLKFESVYLQMAPDRELESLLARIEKGQA